MLTKGRERGTMTVARCGDDRCTGTYRPLSEGSTARDRVVLDSEVAVDKGRTYTVAVKPGSDEVVRTGTGGLLYAWAPLGGALLLASMVVAGGLRLTRLAWAFGGAGLTLLTAAFVTPVEAGQRSCGPPRPKGTRGTALPRRVSRCCAGPPPHR